MPRRSKGAVSGSERRNTTRAANSPTRAVWIIKDGRHRESTGCGAEDYRGRSRPLADYIASKRIDYVRDGIRPPATIPVADVLASTAAIALIGRRAPTNTRRLKTLLAFFGDKVLSEINGDLCRAYVTHAPAPSRREARTRGLARRRDPPPQGRPVLGYCGNRPAPAAMPRERWLTRKEAARA